jgi:hypothetical protein
MRTKFVLLTTIFFTVFLSCSKESEEVSNLDQTPTQLRSGRTAGRSQSVVDISQTREKGRYNNPYYIGTIKAAYTKLKSLGQISATYNITPNALYVRYLPKDENDFYLLETTSPTELFEYPLQENDIQNNEEHHYDDGTLSNDQLPFQYTVCTIGQVLSNFEADILDTLFLNHIDSTISDDDWKKIETEALISTGVIDPNNPNDVQAFIFCNYWFPSGKIEIWDDALSTNLPLKHVKVKMSKWYQWATVYTDTLGNFTTFPNPIMRFCGDVKYSIIYENPIWDIRDGKLGQADTQGPKKKGAWNHVIKDDKKSLGFGTVHRSLVRYFFEDIAGLRRPIVGAQKLKVSYRHEDGDSNGFFSSSGFEGIFYSHVHIFGLKNSTELKETERIFSTTTHELAHVSHAFQMGNIQFWQVSNLIVESWARACQWKITELEYGFSPTLVPGPIQDWYFNQYPNLNNYSPLFIDLEDTSNQNPANLPNRPRDLTSGYNLSLIQSNVLGHSYGLTSLRDRLKSQKPSGVTDAQLDMNLQYYFDNF